MTDYVKVGYDRWVDIPTPLGPDMQVRQVGGAAPPTAVLVWRVKPSITELEEQGLAREESDRVSGSVRHPWPDSSCSTGERRGEGADLRAGLAAAVVHLKSAIDEDERRASATLLFGGRGEQLYWVLAEMPRRILDSGRWRA